MVIDGSVIHYSDTGSSSSSESEDDARKEEDPAEEEKWDLPTLNIGDFITVNVTHPMDQNYDVWAEIVDDSRAVVITPPRQDLPKVRVGDVIEEFKITDLRGQYFACECPPNLEVIYGDPDAFGNAQEDANNQPQKRLVFPSIGILRDRRRDKTWSNRPCRFYPQGACSRGYCCKFKHIDSDIPPGRSFAELRNDGDVRGIPVTNRNPCYHWRDRACRFGNSCKHAHFRHAWAPDNMAPSTTSRPEQPQQPSGTSQSP